MTQQKVIITENADEINEMLNAGWRIVSVTPQHVAGYAGGNTYSSNKVMGNFCFVIEK